MAVHFLDTVGEVYLSVAQELIFLAVFGVSCLLWRAVGQHSKRRRVAKKLDVYDVIQTKAGPKHHAEEKEVGGVAETTPEAPDKLRAGSAQKLLKPAPEDVEKQIMEFLNRREFTKALNLYRRLNCEEICLSANTYTEFIHSAVRVNKTDVAERLFWAMKRNGILPSLKFWQETLRMVSSRKHFQLCLTMEQIFGEQVPVDKVVYSCIINAALELRKVERVPCLLQKYAETDLEVKDYILFFRVYVVLKDAVAAEALFQKLGGSITTMMFNMMLLTVINNGQVERAAQLIQKAHQLERQENAVAQIVDSVSYNTLMKSFTDSQAQLYVKTLQEMVKNGVEPDEITFGTVIDACIEGQHAAGVDEVLTIFKASVADADISKGLIKALLKVNHLPQALDLYEDMKRRRAASAKLGPDLITYSLLIKALVDEKDIDRALALVVDMRSIGLAPDDIIFTHLIEGARCASQFELGKELFKEMLASGLAPSNYTLMALLKLYGRCGWNEEAQALLQGWGRTYGWKPTVIHFTCLMSGCLHMKNYDLAWSAYDLMNSQGVRPDSTTLTTLLPGLTAAQRWDNVLTLTQQVFLFTPRHNIPQTVLHSVLAKMQASGSHADAQQLKELMLAKGIPTTPRSVAARRA